MRLTGSVPMEETPNDSLSCLAPEDTRISSACVARECGSLLKRRQFGRINVAAATYFDWMQ
jgi:hypothetical protein